ncbi:MAG: PKD domain-containing protein [Gemmatimonadales bacterium]
MLHASAEVLNPATGGWSAVGSMGRARSHHRVSALPSGHVLVAGGQAGGAALSEAEVFDPASGAFIAVGQLQSARYDYTVTNLGGQGVLFAQGQSAIGPLASAEIFAAKTGIFAINGAPVAQISGAAAGAEGAELVFSAAGSSDPDGDALTYVWNFGDGSAAVSGFSVTHRYADDGVYTVTLAVSDPSHTTVVERSVTVANVAPAVSALAGASLLAGERYSASGTFADPGADAWSATVDYGDGAGAEALALDGKSFSLSRVYSVAGVYTVRVVVRDDGGEGAAQAQVSVMSSAQAIQAWLVGPIEQWVADGSVNRGNANALIVVLEAAMHQLDRGNPEAALNQLAAFVNQVEAAVRTGRLSADQAEQLLAAVQRVRQAVGAM